MVSSSKNIFISIASYRDPQLQSSILDCINKSKFPRNLYFGICWQKDNSENIDQIKNLPNIKIYDVDWRSSRGACWGRSVIQQELYDNQDLYLQLDSHHRFIENWDEKLIKLLNEAKLINAKSIIGSYGTGYHRLDNKNLIDAPCKINTFDSFTEDCDLISRPVRIKNSSSKSTIISARLLSGHFIFSDAQFIVDCPYDPNFYFRGEELALSARAYCHGYDFFHPTSSIIYHEYERSGDHKHWDDHKKKNGIIVESTELDDRSKARQRQLFHIDDRYINFKQYDLGNKRSLHDYERYAGIDFKNQRVHKFAYNVRDDSPDPYIMTEDEWNSGMMNKYEKTIEWDLSKIDSHDDFDFWFFGFETKSGILLYRNDWKNNNTTSYKIFNKQINKYTAKFSCESSPDYAIIIPHSMKNGWGKRIKIPC